MTLSPSMTEKERDAYLRSHSELADPYYRDVRRLEEGLQLIDELRGQPMGIFLAPRLDHYEQVLQDELGRLSQDVRGLVRRLDDSTDDYIVLFTTPAVTLRRVKYLAEQAREGVIVDVLQEDSPNYQPGFLKERALDRQGLLPDSKDDLVADKPYTWYLATRNRVQEEHINGIDTVAEKVEAAAERLQQQIGRYSAPTDVTAMTEAESEQLRGMVDQDTTVAQVSAALQQLRQSALLSAAAEANQLLAELDQLREAVYELWREDPTEDQPRETPEQ